MYIPSSLALLLGAAVLFTSVPNTQVNAAHLRTRGAKSNMDEKYYLEEEPWGASPPDLFVSEYSALGNNGDRIIASCGKDGFFGYLMKDADDTYFARITAPSDSQFRSSANVKVDIVNGSDSNRGDVSQDGSWNFIGRNTGQFRSVEFVFDKAGSDPRCWTTSE